MQLLWKKKGAGQGQYFLSPGGCKSLDYTQASSELKVTSAVLKPLVEDGIVQIRQEQVYRMPVDGENIPRQELSELSPMQEKALREIEREWQNPYPCPVLIHGVTGSGNTRFMKLIQKTVEEGRQAIVGYRRSPLLIRQSGDFTARSGNKVSVLNSRLSQGERYDQFCRAKQGEIQIMVGPRSALFTPFGKLGPSLSTRNMNRPTKVKPVQDIMQGKPPYSGLLWREPE